MNRKLAIIIAILVLGLFLRIHNYDKYPQRGATSDEYTYTFLGMSLLKDRVPTSWSYFSSYKNKYPLNIDNIYFPIVYPYFDHPPLNGLLVGAWAILNGESEFYQVTLGTIRLVPVVLSMFSAILVYLLGRKIYDEKTALWALLIYTTVTSFVMNGRVVFAENLLTPLLLLALYLYVFFKEKFNQKSIFILGIISGLGFWTKELGIVIFFALLYLLIERRTNRGLIILFVSTMLLFVLGYIGYGLYYDWEVFKGIITAQSIRQIGPQTLLMLTSTPIIVNKIYFDGWYFLGLLSLFIAFTAYHKHKLLLVPAAAYFMLLIFSLTREGDMGWYMIPLYPFMALFSSRFLVEGIRKQNWFVFIFLLFVGLAQIKFVFEDNFGLSPWQFRSFIIIMYLPFITALLTNRKRAFGFLANLWFYLLILGNIYLTYNYIHPA